MKGVISESILLKKGAEATMAQNQPQLVLTDTCGMRRVRGELLSDATSSNTAVVVLSSL